MRRRFLVDEFENGRATLRGGQARHLSRVLRARPGQLYDLSDGHAVWLAKIARVDRDRVEFVLVEPVAAVPLPLESTILVSIFRYARFEWAIEKATELGVAKIQPIAASRSESRLVQMAPHRLSRWQKIAHEAAEQSRRSGPPTVLSPVSATDSFRGCRAELKLLFSERADAPALARLVPRSQPASIALAFGPEGGWTDEELAAAHETGFQEASLGPLILRAETAVIAGLSFLMCAWPRE